MIQILCLHLLFLLSVIRRNSHHQSLKFRPKIEIVLWNWTGAYFHCIDFIYVLFNFKKVLTQVRAIQLVHLFFSNQSK